MTYKQFKTRALQLDKNYTDKEVRMLYILACYIPLWMDDYFNVQ